MYGFGLKHPDERYYAPPGKIEAWFDDPSSMPDNPAYGAAQEALALSLFTDVYPIVRPRPPRPKFDEFGEFLRDEADQLKDLFDAGDDSALYEALKIVRGIDYRCEWAEEELYQRIDKYLTTADIRAFIGKGKGGRGSRKRIGIDRIWKAYIHVAYTVARHADFGKTHALALEVAARILEKIDTGQHGYDHETLKHHLDTPLESVLPLLTIEHASELTHCCCAWFAYIAHNETLPLPSSH